MTDNNTALKKAGLKVTLPRLKILEVLQEPDNHHVSAEDLYKRLIDMGEEIGLAIDEDRQPELTAERVEKWVKQISEELHLDEI
ncbi:MAG: transcriptional repressor, partial [Escherichia coli]|nr:transcriptional repressor [Escherichia coli]